MNPHGKDLEKLIRAAGAGRFGVHEVFADFVEMAAIAFSNRVDLAQASTREARYLACIARYDERTQQRFPEMLGALTMALEQETSDVLGATFHALELHNKWVGQYFTPYPLCKMMAAMQVDERMQEIIDRRGYVTVHEPAAGSGAMVIAFADAMREKGYNPQQQMHATTVDIDRRVVHMAYVQFALLNLPAELIVGNSLSLETFDRWVTPAHVLGGWQRRLAKARDAVPSELSAPPPIVPIDGEFAPANFGQQLGLF